MSDHHATITWARGDAEYTYRTYPREHGWRFGGGSEIQASAAPDFRGDEALVNPEEAFVASLSSCHMLTFLALAARKKLVVERYDDAAVGVLEKNEDGKLAMTRVTLRPIIVFGGTAPSEEDVRRMHDTAHAECFIANSVRTVVTVASGAPPQ